MIEAMDLNKIFRTALKNGGDYAELFEEHSVSTQIQREMKRFQRLNHGLDSGVGLRLVHEGKTLYAYSNDIQESQLLKMAQHLSEAVSHGKTLGDLQFPGQGATMKSLVQIDPSTVPLETKAKQIEGADSLAWGMGSAIQQVSTSYRDQIRHIRIANSLGELCDERQVYVVFVVMVVASDGTLMQTGYEPLGGTDGFEILGEGRAEETAQAAAERALRMLKAPIAPSGLMPVVVAAEAGGTMVHEAVGHGLEADLAREGLSVYQDKLGQKVATELITVLDDPTVPGKRGSFRYDDEGTPAKKNILIDRGVLKNYMYNRNYAMRDGVASTANGRRESYRCRPIVRMTNTMIAPGQSDPAEILRSVDHGLYVTRMGGGQVNTVNGDFVFEVSDAYMIKNGKLDYPVRGATLTGNGPQVLQSIDMVGNDLGFGLGTCGKEGQGVPVADAQPTLRIPGITVGGQG